MVEVDVDEEGLRVGMLVAAAGRIDDDDADDGEVVDSFPPPPPTFPCTPLNTK